MVDENELEQQAEEFKVSDRRFAVRGYEDEEETESAPEIAPDPGPEEVPAPQAQPSQAAPGDPGVAPVSEENPPSAAPEGEPVSSEEGAEAPEEAPSREFETLLAILQTNAIAAMGINPQTGEKSGGADPKSAKLFVDLISMVKEKMTGNLSEEEDRILTQVLSELRMMYVQHVGIG
ncbi:MAG: DUF1844 domain-containing protein [Nitrospinaceae bacterium]|jgi:hypothetical protein|nr:DUF1844 domain-containing protein [Nitrospinaceae bacterium]MBT3432795.1 DUF1844 domain-containing protein [Nitrospinaceae bacterium]MBT3820131.1 DUF1844 domain-containing protein [Nitrospinaceae bacterium]MBT4092997.1 DUF1844 domain-containing protein [Nitrospinaceae bacterium]MBT4431139.1 DUF1844 domain-containing protein [Nitrospinaceae bacterium]